MSGRTLDESNYLEINDVKISGFQVQDNDADGKLIDAINHEFDETGVLAEIDANGRLVLTAEDGRNIEFEFVGGGAGPTVRGGKVSLISSKSIDLRNMGGAAGNDVALGNNGLTDETYIGAGESSTPSAYDVSTATKAFRTMHVVDFALEQLSAQRSLVGALQNRLTSTVYNLSQTQENLSSARARIQDADFAQETALLSRSQIIQQATVSVLAQSQSIGSLALSLLN